MRHALLAILCLLAGIVSTAAAAPPPANPLFDDLLTKGVPFGARARLLRQPTLTDGMDGAQQKAAIQAVLNMRVGRRVTYQQFIANGLHTPSVLLVDDSAAPAGPGHTIDLWFTVHGPLHKVADPKLLKSMFKPDKNDKIDTLTDKQLKKRDITPQHIAGLDEYFAHGTFRMMPANVTVQVEATARIVQTTGGGASVLAGLIDPRFNGDANFPNEWRPATVGGNGGLQLGAPVQYTSAGGYTKITELLGEPGIELVEYHLVYDEPQGWFNGQNPLRPHLAQQAEDDVQKYRREILLR